MVILMIKITYILYLLSLIVIILNHPPYSSYLQKENCIKTIIVDINGNGNYTSLAEAVWEADNGDLIRVYDGIYNENIKIRKELIIIGNGTSTIIIPDKNWYNAVVDVESDNVEISNLSIVANNEIRTGIGIGNYTNIKISNIVINDGIDGIHISETKNSILENVTLLNFSEEGIVCWRTNNISILNSTITNCSNYGMEITCTYLNIINTRLVDSSFIFQYFGEMDFSSVNIDESYINGKLIKFYYQENNINIASDNTVIAYDCSNVYSNGFDSEDRYNNLYFYYCNDVKLNNCNFGKSIHDKLFFYGTNNIVISNSTFNQTGMKIINSNIIKIKENTYDGDRSDIYFDDSSNISIRKNNFSNNDFDIGHEIGVSIEAMNGYSIEIIDNRFENNIIGIWLVENIINANINNNTFISSGSAIYSKMFNKLIIEFNVFENGTIGIRLSEGIESNMNGNRIENIMYGIDCQYSSQINILNTHINNSNSAGMQLIGLNNGEISNSTIENSEKSISLSSISNFDINKNFIKNSNIGVYAYDVENSIIYNNFFIENKIQIQSTGNIKLNRPYPVGGNYWSDYIGSDLKKGSQQDEEGSDGFGDTPYNKNNVRDTYPIFIDTILPDAVAGPDMTIDLGEAYHFDATDSTDDQMVTDFEWSFEYDGEEVVRELAEFDFQFDIAGVYDCELTVSDFAGNMDTDSFTLTVEDSSAPVIVTQGNLTVNQGELAFFSAAGTTDLSPISEYKWTFQHEGKEEVLKGPDVSFRFTEVGVHEIQLKVTDSEGNFGYSYFYVTVIDTEDPVATPGPDIEIENGEVANFDGSGSTDNDVIEEYVWTFDYGGRTETLSGENPSFLFNIPGYYTITLTVSDSEGNSHSDSLEVTVIDTISPEAVIAGSTKLIEGDPLELSGQSSTDNGNIVKYVWNFTDGEEIIVEGPDLDHTLQRQGYIDITLTVYDEWNNSDSTTITVEVPDTKKPKASAGEDLTVKKGTIVTLDGSSSTDNGKISTWKWKFDYDGEEQVLEGDVVTFKFDHTGTYEIELTVTDQFLNRGTDKVIVTVLDNGTLSGIVKDKDGTPIQGAKVTVIDSGGNQYTATTGTDGSFSVSVPEGQVTWTIEKSGYEKIEGTSSIEIMENTDLSSSDTMMKRSEGDGESPIVLIIVIVVILLLVGIGLAVFFFMKNKKTEQVEIENPDSTDTINESENDLIRS